MSGHMGRLDEYEALVAVLSQGSIRRAAEVTGVPRTTVARSLRRLEERLGAPLFLSEGGGLHATPLARRLAADAERLLAEAERIEREAAQACAPALRLTAPPSGGLPGLSAMFAQFTAQHPEIAVSLLGTARFMDLAREDVHIALRARGAADPDHVQVSIVEVVWGLWASPSYLSEAGTPADRDAALRHPLLLPAVSGPDMGELPLPPPTGTRVRLQTDDLAVLEAAAQAGAGLAVLPSAEGMARAGLVAVLPALWGAPQAICAVYHRRWRQQPEVRAFLAFARRWYVP